MASCSPRWSFYTFTGLPPTICEWVFLIALTKDRVDCLLWLFVVIAFSGQRHKQWTKAAAAVWFFFSWLKLLKPKIWSLKRKINTKWRPHILITFESSYFSHLLLKQIDSSVFSTLSFWITKRKLKESRKSSLDCSCVSLRW